MTAYAAEPAVTRKPAHVLRAQLRGFLDDWQGLLSGNVAEARPLLDLVLADRIDFTPTADRGYQLTVPVVFDRVLTAAVSDLRGLQDRVASLTVPELNFTLPPLNEVAGWLQRLETLRKTGQYRAA